MNLTDLPLGRFLNAVYAWLIQRVEDVAEFDRMLSEPPAGAPRQVKQEDVQAELADFGAFMAAVTG